MEVCGGGIWHLRGEIFELLGAFLSGRPTGGRPLCLAGLGGRPGPEPHSLANTTWSRSFSQYWSGHCPGTLPGPGVELVAKGPSAISSWKLPHLLLLVSERWLLWSAGKGMVSVSQGSTVSPPRWPSGKICTTDLWPFSGSSQCSPCPTRDACYVIKFG